MTLTIDRSALVEASRAQYALAVKAALGEPAGEVG